MTDMRSSKGLAALAAAALALQPLAASAQQSCLTENEVSAIALYSLPSLVRSVQLRCDGQLAPGGYLARRGDSLIARYSALQNGAWPRAKSGVLKILAGKAANGGNRQNLEMISGLPDEAVRPLVDALIVQELSPKIDVEHCGRIERMIEIASPIDPEIAGSLLGAVAGIVNHDELPVCPARRT
jgi:hypothetical protein